MFGDNAIYGMVFHECSKWFVVLIMCGCILMTTHFNGFSEHGGEMYYRVGWVMIFAITD